MTFTAPLNSRKPRRWLACVGLLGAVAIASPALAEDVKALAQQLSKLRAEVESLTSQLSAKSTETSDRLRSLARQKADLELEQKREQGRLSKVSAHIEKRRREIAAEKERGNELVPLFRESAEQVKSYISASLPFRTSERLGSVTKLEDQYKAGLVNPSTALLRLWGVMEDEFRMSRENGLFRQTINVDGQEQLADVIRIGMVMLYYQGADGSVGRAVRSGDAWSYVPFSGPTEVKQVNELFSSFKKQIRVGYFELPGALTSSVEVSK